MVCSEVLMLFEETLNYLGYSVLGDFAERIVTHFISAEIKHFAFDELCKAQSWVLEAESE